MYLPKEDLQCGVFDSTILRRGHVKSQDRRVVYYELELFHTAGGTSYVEEGYYPTRRGMLLCAKPGQIRHSDFPVRCSFLRIKAGLDADVDRLLSAAPDCFYIEDDDKIEELMGLLAKMGSYSVSSASQELNTMRMNAGLMEILYRCMRLWQGSHETVVEQSVNQIVRDAYEYINENFSGDCALKDIANALHISPNHLHTMFRQSTGSTPYETVSQRRIEKAKKLIVTGEMTMSQIALETGFCSQSHFNKVFKEKTGQTPIAYRRSLLEEY
ncbi:MAG: helix-turn-helix transcriptional regulator [Clostridia bacterium]|nr:helix-turn-helix transcriptional regulator [Clostridia bacterium]